MLSHSEILGVSTSTYKFMDRYNSSFNSSILSDCSIMSQTLSVLKANLIIWIFLGNKLDYFPQLPWSDQANCFISLFQIGNHRCNTILSSLCYLYQITFSILFSWNASYWTCYFLCHITFTMPHQALDSILLLQSSCWGMFYYYYFCFYTSLMKNLQKSGIYNTIQLPMQFKYPLWSMQLLVHKGTVGYYKCPKEIQQNSISVRHHKNN